MYIFAGQYLIVPFDTGEQNLSHDDKMKNVVIIYLKVDPRLFLKQVYFILPIVAVNIPSSIFIEENPFVGISYFVAINKNRLEEYSKLKVCRFLVITGRNELPNLGKKGYQ